jgi:serine O-acetyltransferase
MDFPVNDGKEISFLPDWGRERKKWHHWNPSVSLLISFRSYQKWPSKPGPINTLLRFIAKWRFRLWSVICGADIGLGASIGGGLLLPHPNGVVIHSDAIIGNNCMIMQQVTIGQLATAGAPKIGSAVYIGAGAKVLGAISLGDYAAIGANSVVLINVPSACTAVGVPARLVPTLRA